MRQKRTPETPGFRFASDPVKRLAFEAATDFHASVDLLGESDFMSFLAGYFYHAARTSRSVNETHRNRFEKLALASLTGITQRKGNA